MPKSANPAFWTQTSSWHRASRWEPGAAQDVVPRVSLQGGQWGEAPGSCPTRGTGPKLGGSPGAAPSVSKPDYNTPGEAIWDQTGLGENQLLPVTGLLGFQPNLGTAAVSAPAREPAQTQHFSISVHAGIGAATGADWCGPAAGWHSTGMCWEALPRSDGRSCSCPTAAAPSPDGDSRGGHRAPPQPRQPLRQEPGTTEMQPAVLAGAGGSWGNQSRDSRLCWAGERDFLLPRCRQRDSDRC